MNLFSLFFGKKDKRICDKDDHEWGYWFWCHKSEASIRECENCKLRDVKPHNSTNYYTL